MARQPQAAGLDLIILGFRNQAFEEGFERGEATS
jgi:hypothetical protein